MNRLFVANWKMNMLRAEAESFCAQFAPQISKLLSACTSGNCTANATNCEIGIAPPYVAIDVVRRALATHGIGSVMVGAQNCHWLEKGAHTGELSAPMLKELGCEFAILGHSERRQFYGESNEGVAKRAHSVMTHGLRAIVCVGETESEYRAGKTLQVVESQLTGSLAELSNETVGARMSSVNESSASKLVIAYEPVWAIGTGLAATPEIAANVHDHIRSWLKSRLGAELAESIPLLYGGSTTPENVSELCSQPNIDGALVGGASLKPDTFAELCLRGSR